MITIKLSALRSATGALRAIMDGRARQKPSLKFTLSSATALALVVGTSMLMPGTNRVIALKAPDVVALEPHDFYYRPAGDFTREGKLVDPPARLLRLDRVLTIMTHQVTAAEYQRCALNQACPATFIPGAFDRPAVRISWHDASAYAAWLSRLLRARYRLPTDEEWAFAAGSRFPGEVLPDRGIDPAERWLQRYGLEPDDDGYLDNTPRAVGSFGANENGVFDLAGNVWEWTNTCFVHKAVNSAGTGTAIVNCGVRVVEGRHRTYMTDFIRDPRAGGCAVGKPPGNLGFRLVRE